jgi:hypothetical protein
LIDYISAGDFCQKGPGRADHLNAYLGSGRSGCCFGWHGLHHPAGAPAEIRGVSNTFLAHADHWGYLAYGLDAWLPVLRLLWKPGPPEASASSQHLDVYHGLLTTRLEVGGAKVQLRNTFHPGHRDLLAIELTWEGADRPLPDVFVELQVQGETRYGQRTHAVSRSVQVDPATHQWRASLDANPSETRIAAKILSMQGTAQLTVEDDGLRIRLSGQAQRGRHLLLVGVVARHRLAEMDKELQHIVDPTEYLAEAAAAWERRWGDAWVQLPDPKLQALWARSVYYILCSYAPDVRAPAPPMGWAGNVWPFHFPQDISYIHPALLRLGHYDIARASVEHYRATLGQTQEATRRIYNRPGAMWPWEYPISNDFGGRLLAEGAPNPFQYEIHNAAYPARMAAETAAHLQDRTWAREIAWPVVRESARFLGALAQRQRETWNVQAMPSMGQDEFGGPDACNYLCALQSTQYALQTAVRMAQQLQLQEPELQRWQAILNDGLAFDRLADPALGMRATAENLVGTPWLGRQKHPVQLNSLTFLPLCQEFDEPTRLAYRRRNELCAGMTANTSYGWTLAAYWLAASHMGDGKALAAEFNRMEQMRYVDPAWIQIYETSGAKHAPYYVTSHGLYVQAVCDALVSDFSGQTRIGAAVPPGWEEARYANLRTADGGRHSGSCRGDFLHGK